MGDTVEDAEEIECNSKKSSQSFKTLKTLERRFTPFLNYLYLFVAQTFDFQK